MAFEGLSERLENSFKKLRAKGKLTESDVKEAMREVRLALLEADVNYKVSKEFTSKVTERAIGADVMESLTPGQMVIKIVNEELTELMGGNESRLAIANHPPTIVMMCGLQGSGKTTHSAKLALKLKKEGLTSIIISHKLNEVSYVADKITGRFLLHAMFIVRQLLNNFRLLVSKSEYLCLKWELKILFTLHKKL